MTIWSLVPDTIRILTYRLLVTIGTHLYGPSSSLRVQRLPFGLYLKARLFQYRGSLENEYGALELVRRHTDVVVPRPLDLVSDAKDAYLLTSTISGCPLGLCIDGMNDEELTGLANELRRWLEQIRSIPREPKST